MGRWGGTCNYKPLLNNKHCFVANRSSDRRKEKMHWMVLHEAIHCIQTSVVSQVASGTDFAFFLYSFVHFLR